MTARAEFIARRRAYLADSLAKLRARIGELAALAPADGEASP